MLRTICVNLCASVVPLLLLGCSSEFNRTPTKLESDSITDVVTLTTGFDRAGEAYFSPDMQWIIFQAINAGDPRYKMYLAKIIWVDDGMPRIDTPIQISPANSANTCGYFSPDGVSLIFASTAGKEKQSVASGGYNRAAGGYKWDFDAGMEIFRADGWEYPLGALGKAGSANLAKYALTNNDFYDAECAYSPDGRQIIFTSTRTGDPELFIMDADGKNVKQLTHSPGYDGGAFFSPDEKSIVWRTDRKEKDLLQIHVADITPDGLKNEKALTDDKNVNWAPYWHPAGKHIVYTTSLQGHQNYEVYVMRRDGTRKTQITHSDGFDGLPVISPDGKYLMWSSKRTGTTQVTIARFHLPKGS